MYLHADHADSHAFEHIDRYLAALILYKYNTTGWQILSMSWLKRHKSFSLPRREESKLHKAADDKKNDQIAPRILINQPLQSNLKGPGPSPTRPNIGKKKGLHASVWSWLQWLLLFGFSSLRSRPDSRIYAVNSRLTYSHLLLLKSDHRELSRMKSGKGSRAACSIS